MSLTKPQESSTEAPQAPSPEPAYFGHLRDCPVGSTTGAGWLGDYLGHMAKNLTGRLDECGYPFNTPGFACEKIDIGKRKGAEWWPYEQVGYWLDGIVRCAQAMSDERAAQQLVAKADQQIDYVLNDVGTDGFIGPDHLRTNDKQDARWGLVPFFAV